MTEKMSQEQIEKIYLTCVVKDLIHTRAYSGDPAYKWLDETWSVREILEALSTNNIESKEEGVRYLLDIAHLFGKDK
jgi:hypothetical protein